MHCACSLGAGGSPNSSRAHVPSGQVVQRRPSKLCAPAPYCAHTRQLVALAGRFGSLPASHGTHTAPCSRCAPTRPTEPPDGEEGDEEDSCV